jgi:hypothetical protein
MKPLTTLPRTSIDWDSLASALLPSSSSTSLNTTDSSSSNIDRDTSNNVTESSGSSVVTNNSPDKADVALVESEAHANSFSVDYVTNTEGKDEATNFDNRDTTAVEGQPSTSPSVCSEVESQSQRPLDKPEVNNNRSGRERVKVNIERMQWRPEFHATPVGHPLDRRHSPIRCEQG